jgi:hypothetical protein
MFAAGAGEEATDRAIETGGLGVGRRWRGGEMGLLGGQDVRVGWREHGLSDEGDGPSDEIEYSPSAAPSAPIMLGEAGGATGMQKERAWR